MMYRSSLVALLLFGLTLNTQAQTYKIQIKEFPDEGKKIEQDRIQKSSGTVKRIVSGKTMEAKLNDFATTESLLETLEKGSSRPKKFQKTYTKAIFSRNKKEEPAPYQGQTITFELKGDSYEAKVKGSGVLKEEVLKFLQGEANEAAEIGAVLIPTKEVKVDESWEVPGASLAKAMTSLPLDPAKSSGTGKLVKVYDKGGHKFGVLELELKLAITTFSGVKLESPLTGTSKFTLDVAIDGSTTEGTEQMSMKIAGKASGTDAEGKKASIDVDLQVTGTQTMSAEK